MLMEQVALMFDHDFSTPPDVFGASDVVVEKLRTAMLQCVLGIDCCPAWMVLHLSCRVR